MPPAISVEVQHAPEGDQSDPLFDDAPSGDVADSDTSEDMSDEEVINRLGEAIKEYEHAKSKQDWDGAAHAFCAMDALADKINGTDDGESPEE